MEVLSGGQAAGSARSELARGGREDALDQGALAVAGGWEVRAHLGSDAMELPAGLAPLGGDDAVGAQLVKEW